MGGGEKLVIAGAIVFLALFIVASIAAEKQWQEYAVAHHCRVVGEKESSTGMGISSNGKPVTVYNPSQTIYNCDGGEIRIR